MAINNFLIFSVNGGAGKNILATAVIKAIKKTMSDKNIIILTAYPDVWLNNPDIYRTYTFGQAPHFYTNYVKDKNVKIYAIEPYTHNDYILKKKHLIDIWCDLCGVTYNNEKTELYFNQREIEFTQRKWLNNRKIFLLQTNGGAPQDIKISWMRDMPLSTAQQIVNRFANEYTVIHIRRDDQPILQNTEQFKGNLRELFGLIRLSHKRLFIDSICQHAAAALKKPSTVTWVRNSPEMLGYTIHDNIVTKVSDEIDVLQNSVLEPYDITGNIYQCPFKEGTELFNTHELINSILNQPN